MTKLTGTLAMAFAMALGASAARADEPFIPKKVIAPVERVFAPAGFDDNDNAQVVLHGHFPSPCYKLGPTKLAVDPASRSVRIRQGAYHYDKGDCPRMLVSWTSTVDVGILRQGRYSVHVEQSAGDFRQMAAFPVRQAKSAAPDDFLYAQVQEITLDGPGDAGNGITLHGDFHMDCLKIEDVKVAYDKKGIVEILPVLGYIPNHPCRHILIPIPFKHRLETRRLKGDVLYHVRSMNGAAVNKVVEYGP